MEWADLMSEEEEEVEAQEFKTPTKRTRKDKCEDTIGQSSYKNKCLNGEDTFNNIDSAEVIKKM